MHGYAVEVTKYALMGPALASSRTRRARTARRRRKTPLGKVEAAVVVEVMVMILITALSSLSCLDLARSRIFM